MPMLSAYPMAIAQSSCQMVVILPLLYLLDLTSTKYSVITFDIVGYMTIEEIVEPLE